MLLLKVPVLGEYFVLAGGKEGERKGFACEKPKQMKRKHFEVFGQGKTKQLCACSSICLNLWAFVDCACARRGFFAVFLVCVDVL